MLRANAIGVGQFLGFCVGSADVPSSALIFSQRKIGEQWLIFKDGFYSHTRSGPDFFSGGICRDGCEGKKSPPPVRRTSRWTAKIQLQRVCYVRISIEAICCR